MSFSLSFGTNVWDVWYKPLSRMTGEEILKPFVQLFKQNVP